MWNNFINGYCKVDFLCYEGEPNWLGWFNLIVLGIIISFSIIFGLLSTIEREINIRKINTINKREKSEIVNKEYNLY